MNHRYHIRPITHIQYHRRGFTRLKCSVLKCRVYGFTMFFTYPYMSISPIKSLTRLVRRANMFPVIKNPMVALGVPWELSCCAVNNCTRVCLLQKSINYGPFRFSRADTCWCHSSWNLRKYEVLPVCLV